MKAFRLFVLDVVRAEAYRSLSTVPDVQEVPKRNTDRSHLTHADIALALQLRQADKTQSQIAEIIGCHRSAISRLFIELTDTSVEAAQIARSRAVDVTKATIDGAIRSAKAGKCETGLELLDRLDIAPKKDRGSVGTTVQILVGNTGQVAQRPPVLELEPAPATDTE